MKEEAILPIVGVWAPILRMSQTSEQRFANPQESREIETCLERGASTEWLSEGLVKTQGGGQANWETKEELQSQDRKASVEEKAGEWDWDI